MNKWFTFICFAVLSCGLLTGCYVADTNMPLGVNDIPEGHGLIFGSYNLGLVLGNNPWQIEISKDDETIIKKKASNASFRYILPAGKIKIELLARGVEIGRTDIGSLDISRYDTNTRLFTTYVNVPSDTAVYVGKFLCLKDQYRIKGGTVVEKYGIKSFDIMEWIDSEKYDFNTLSKYDIDLKASVRYDLQINRHGLKQFYKDTKILCEQFEKSIVMFSPEWVFPN